MIWVGRLISAAIVLQTLELFFVKPWRWEILKEEFPKFLRPLFHANRSLLALRLFVALAAILFPHPAFIVILFLTTWMIAIRWRGTFNGGSDAMTFLLLGAWMIAAFFPWAESMSRLFVVIQLVLSYLVAGLSKLVSPQWQTGEAPQYFLKQAGVLISRQSAFTLGWMVILFECLSPIAVFFPYAYCLLALLFHLSNVYVFGLNRFFFVWLAAYPALFYSVMH